MKSRQKKFDCVQRIFLKPLELQSKEKSYKALTLQALNRTSLALLSCLVRRLEKNNKAPRSATLQRKGFHQTRFPVNATKFYKTFFLQKPYERFFLKVFSGYPVKSTPGKRVVNKEKADISPWLK